MILDYGTTDKTEHTLLWSCLPITMFPYERVDQYAEFGDSLQS